MLLTAITLVIQLLPQILQAAGVVSPAIAKLIGDLSSSIPGVITALATGKSVPNDVLVILAAFKAELATLSADTNLPAHALGMATTLTLAINNAIIANQLAATVDDPSTLTDLPTNLEAGPAVDAAKAGNEAMLAGAAATIAAVVAHAAALAAVAPDPAPAQVAVDSQAPAQVAVDSQAPAQVAVVGTAQTQTEGATATT